MSVQNISTTDQEQLKLAAHAALARQDYLAFATFIDPAYQTPPHIRMLGGYLNRVEAGDVKRLMIIEPPQHGKSEATSGRFPSWVIGKHPTWKVMMACHSADLAETFSVQNRTTIDENPRWRLVFPEVRLNPKRKRADIWAVNRQRENVIASGIMGGLTGYGANLLLFDDPIKTYEQANSITYRNKVYNEYKSAGRTRLAPDNRIIIIMTHWHEDDLMGRILNSPEGKDWTILHLPALSYGVPEDYEHLEQMDRDRVTLKLPKTAYPDRLGRPKGTPLWANRYDKEFLDGQRTALGHEFEGMYQGHPGSPEGEKFKRDSFRPITPLILSALQPRVHSRIRSYDLAWSAKQRADYTVGLRATLHSLDKERIANITNEDALAYLRSVKMPPVFVVLEGIYRTKQEWDELSESIIDLAESDTDTYQIMLEAQAAQNTGVKSLRKDDRLWKHDLLSVQVTGDKEMRAKYSIRLVSSGMVFTLYQNLATPPEWETEFLDELGVFPNGTHDDQVDAFTQLVNHWQPVIDSILNEKGRGEWVTPFMSKAAARSQHVKRLPPEFVTRPRVSTSMGWIV